MPVHGEYRHLQQHGELAERLGMNKKDIFILETGQTLELTKNSARKSSKVTSGAIMIDGLGIGDVGSIVLRDRKHLSQDGILTVVVTIEKASFSVVSGPNIITRGFVYMKESGELIREATEVVALELDKCMEKRIIDWFTIKSNIRRGLGEFLYNKTGRKPIILPVIMEI
jgi:Predicted hydrolase of the metallo-beta-lactamase superfamily